eukprot:533772-Pelagomonas_calceolata.AAC.12
MHAEHINQACAYTDGKRTGTHADHTSVEFGRPGHTCTATGTAPFSSHLQRRSDVLLSLDRCDDGKVPLHSSGPWPYRRAMYLQLQTESRSASQGCDLYPGSVRA